MQKRVTENPETCRRFSGLPGLGCLGRAGGASAGAAVPGRGFGWRPLSRAAAERSLLRPGIRVGFHVTVSALLLEIRSSKIIFFSLVLKDY